MHTIYSSIAIMLLLAVNGFFVAAEFALVKARGFRLESQALAGSNAARLSIRIQSNLEPYLAACQLGITMASLGLGWIGEPAVAALLEPLFLWVGIPETALHTSAFVIGFLLFSSLHIVIGEQVPKTLAIRQAESVSRWAAYPLHVSYLIVWPLNWVLNRSTRAILTFFNVAEATHADVLTGDELKGLVATSRDYGALKERKAFMLRNLFEFDERQASRVMIPRGAVHELDLSGDPENNLAVIRDSEHSRFPIIDSAKDDAIVGIILARDIHRAILAGAAEPWRDLTSFCREPLVVPEYQGISELFELMRSRQAHMAFVVDEYGVFLGVVTLEDLLEEIVGEIHDETDDAETSAPVVVLDDRRWEADGLASLADLERAIGLAVPEDLDANTVSGLVMQRLAHMPAPDEEIVEGDFRVRVLTLADRRVGRVMIERIDDPDDNQQSTINRDAARDGVV